MTVEESRIQLLETLIKDTLKHLSETLDKAMSLQKELDIANRRIEKLREAHQRNANEDYRGNRSSASVRSFDALKKDDEIK